MRIRQACAYMLMVGGMLLFAGGASQAEHSKNGGQSDSTMGSGSGGAMKQDQESSGKMGQDVITEDNPGGIVTRGGRGDVPSSSKVDPLTTDQRDDSNLGSKPSSGSRSGNKGSSGSMGSSGGASGGAGGR